MTYKFKKALLRNPSKSISSAISSRGLKPNFAKVVDEQNSYIDALINSGLKVHILDAIEEFPDSIFIEDPAIVYENYCVLLRPGTMSRFGESKALESEVKKYFDQVYLVKEGKIEGGDILRINDHFIIGLSNRTDIKGAENLSYVLKKLGATVEISKTPEGVLHFKSDCSLIDEETILLTKLMSKLEIFEKKYRIIEIPEGEEVAANSLRVNSKLLVPKGFNRTYEKLSKNYDLLSLDVSEISKVDAGLSCMSLRW